MDARFRERDGYILQSAGLSGEHTLDKVCSHLLVATGISLACPHAELVDMLTRTNAVHESKNPLERFMAEACVPRRARGHRDGGRWCGS